MRILEALCVSQGWDLAIQWDVDSKKNRLEFSTAWGAPGHRAETTDPGKHGAHPCPGAELPGRAWKEGRAVWIADLSRSRPARASQSALRQEMVSGWAVPVRVGNDVLAVLEFYCHFRLREDREAMAAIESAATSLGQMLARSHEQGRAEELYRQQEILLDSVADGICGVDRNGMVSFANPAAARLLGASASRSPASRYTICCMAQRPPTANAPRIVPCAAHRTASRQRPAKTPSSASDGSSFPAEYSLTPILDQGRFSGSVLSFRDISQRKPSTA